LHAAQRGLGDIMQCFLGQESLVAGHQHVGHGDEEHQYIVIENGGASILIEDLPFLLVDIQRRRPDLLAFDTFQQSLALHVGRLSRC